MVTEFYPNNLDKRDAVREVLVAWQQIHTDTNSEQLYPWRLRLNPRTGLPKFVRYRLQGNKLTDDDTENLTEIQSGLLTEPYATALFGTSKGEEFFRREFVPENVPIIRVAPTASHPQPMRHYIWRQVYRDIPVIGGTLGVHGAINDDRLAIVSSYLPIPEDYFADLAPMEGLEEKVRERIVKHAQFDTMQIASMRITPVKLFNRLHAIQPYRSSYRLFQRFKLQLPSDNAWLIDVDVHSAEVLGQPWQTTLYANYYASSAEAAGASAQGGAGAAGATIPTGVLTQNDWTDVKNYIKTLASDGTLNDFTDDGTTESATVAAFVLRMRNHLFNHGVDHGVVPTILQQFRDDQGNVTMPAIAVRLNSDRTLTELDTMPLQVHFHADTGNGISIAGRPGLLHHPARDPEVILHEFAHAFLYLFNPAAWNIPSYTVPFVKALQEGHAFYLARSVAVFDNPTTVNQAWAIAAYPPAEWAHLWDLGRASQVDGEDRLPAPNLLPQLSADNDLDCAHTVGMLWARSLWDLRKLLGEGRVDELLIRGYPYLHGYIIDFELVIEAMLDIDIRLVNNVHLADSSQAIWAARRIIGGLGFAAFAETSSGNLYTGGENGVYHWQQTKWALENTTQQATRLHGVNAVGAYDTLLFAATSIAPTTPINNDTQWQGGVFGKDTGTNNDWRQIPNWPFNSVPLCIQTINQDLIVGSNNGIHYLLDNQWDTLNPMWKSPSSPDANEPIIHFAVELRTGGLSPIIWGISPGAVYRQAWSDSNRNDAKDWNPYLNAPTPLTSIAIWQNRIIVGRFDGLYETLLATRKWSTAPVHGGTQPILALTVGNDPDSTGANQQVLYYATPNKVVKWLPNGNHQDLLLPTGTGEISITSLYAQGTTLWAGTVAHGIYKWETGSWSRVFKPVLPISLRLEQMGEVGLLSLMLDSPAALSFTTPATITLEKIVQPGCPLAFIDVDQQTQRYPCQAGTTILVVRNKTNSVIELTMERVNDDITLKV